MWKMESCRMFDKNGKYNRGEIDDFLKQGYEPFAAASNTYGSQGGSFLAEVGQTDTEIFILFKKQE